MLEKNGIWSVFCGKTSTFLCCLLNGIKEKRKKAFTLTEMLIALVVVAVLAVLILPVVTTRAQNKSFALSYESQVKQMLNSLTGLHVMENKTDFRDTMMFVDHETEDYKDSSGAYINKYMKVAKYCNNEPGDCFAQKYYEYKANDREQFDSSVIKGACALLKNGASICLRPQVKTATGGVEEVSGWLDLNGPKGPNVYGRDLRTFRINLSDRVAYSEEDPMTVIMPSASDECIGSSCQQVPDACIDAPASEECCKKKVITAAGDPCCNWYTAAGTAYHDICWGAPEDPKDPECKDHSIENSDDACCLQKGGSVQDPNCCSDSDTSDYCCATKNAGTQACCEKGIAAGTIKLNEKHACCKNAAIAAAHIQECVNPCELDKENNKGLTDTDPEAWRKGASISYSADGSYCCDYYSRRKEILKIGSKDGYGPRDGCCMFKNDYDDKTNPVSASHCCRLQKFPLTNPDELNELCCVWRFKEADLNGKSWLKTHNYIANMLDNAADDNNLSLDKSENRKFDSCCSYAMSQIAKMDSDGNWTTTTGDSPWADAATQAKVWQNCCSIGSMLSGEPTSETSTARSWTYASKDKGTVNLSAECCHFLVANGSEADGYGRPGLREINPKTGKYGILRNACCGYDEFKDYPECCSMGIDGLNVFRKANEQWREICCMPGSGIPNGTYTEDETTVSGPSIQCCLEAGPKIVHEGKKWFWSETALFKKANNNRLNGCCSQGTSIAEDGTQLRKHDKWLVNCCYLRYKDSTAYENAADFVRGCCSDSSEYPAKEEKSESWATGEDNEHNEDCCLAYASSGDLSSHSRDDQRWWSRCCQKEKTNSVTPHEFHFRDGGCCRNVNWVEDGTESCCQFGIDNKTGKNLRELDDEYWYSNCCNYDTRYKGAKSKGKTGFAVYRRDCCYNEKSWDNDGDRLTSYGVIRTKTDPKQQTYEGESHNKYCCDPDIATPDEAEVDNHSGAPSEQCCKDFVANDAMVYDWDEKKLSEAYRGRCCRHYAGMRDQISNLNCNELWICQANGTNSTDPDNNPGYGLPTCCHDLKGNNKHDIWRGSCCDFPEDYVSNADYRTVCCAEDEKDDYHRVNRISGSSVVKSGTEVYCCKPDIVDQGVAPNTNCCYHFKHNRSNYRNGNGPQAVAPTEDYKIECCAQSSGAVDSETDYCPDCDIRWKAGLASKFNKHAANAYSDTAWKHYNFSGCCTNSGIHSTYGNQDVWLDNCCNYVGTSISAVNKWYGSHKIYREHCCGTDEGGDDDDDDDDDDDTCSEHNTDGATKECCTKWGESNIAHYGVVSACCTAWGEDSDHKKLCCSDTTFKTNHYEFCNCDKDNPTKACCDIWQKSFASNGLKDACCAVEAFKNANTSLCGGDDDDDDDDTCGTPNADGATKECCTEWGESNIAHYGVVSACCTAWGEDSDHKKLCCSDTTFKTNHYEFCNCDKDNPTKACCDIWQKGFASNGLKDACCAVEAFKNANTSLCGGGGEETCPATPDSTKATEPCCTEWNSNSKFANGAYSTVLNKCCSDYASTFGTNNKDLCCKNAYDVDLSWSVSTSMASGQPTINFNVTGAKDSGQSGKLTLTGIQGILYCKPSGSNFDTPYPFKISDLSGIRTTNGGHVTFTGANPSMVASCPNAPVISSAVVKYDGSAIAYLSNITSASGKYQKLNSSAPSFCTADSSTTTTPAEEPATPKTATCTASITWNITASGTTGFGNTNVFFIADKVTAKSIYCSDGGTMTDEQLAEFLPVINSLTATYQYTTNFGAVTQTQSVTATSAEMFNNGKMSYEDSLHIFKEGIGLYMAINPGDIWKLSSLSCDLTVYGGGSMPFCSGTQTFAMTVNRDGSSSSLMQRIIAKFRDFTRSIILKVTDVQISVRNKVNERKEQIAREKYEKELAKHKNVTGTSAFAKTTITVDQDNKIGVTTPDWHCCVPEHAEPTFDCCKAFKDNKINGKEYNDFDGNPLSHDYKLRCCNMDERLCPTIPDCVPGDEENNDALDNCRVREETGDPKKWAITQCCACLNDRRVDDVDWKKTCCPYVKGTDNETLDAIRAKTALKIALNDDAAYRSKCCIAGASGSDGSIYSTKSNDQDERCCNYTAAANANAFCCAKKQNAKNSTGTVVAWEITKDGKEDYRTSPFRNACCMNVADKYCSCTNLYDKWKSSSSNLYNHMGTNRTTCCADTNSYGGKAGETAWKEACCIVARDNTSTVVGSDANFSTLCCNTSQYSFYYNTSGSYNATNKDYTNGQYQDERCCKFNNLAGAGVSGTNYYTKGAQRIGSGNYYCCAARSAKYDSNVTHSDEARNADCCKSEGIRYGNGNDPQCCTYNSANAITDQCCAWRRDATNAPSKWIPWDGSLASDSFRNSCCTKFASQDTSKKYCTCEYNYASNKSHLTHDCCVYLHTGYGTSTGKHGTEDNWRENCCKLTVPSGGSISLGKEQWQPDCCVSKKSGYYDNGTVGCCTWRRDNTVFDRGENAFTDKSTNDGCCAWWNSNDQDTYHKRCCHNDKTDESCCTYMREQGNTTPFFEGSGCCIWFPNDDRCLDRCTHYRLGHDYYYSSSGKTTLTEADKISCCQSAFSNSAMYNQNSTFWHDSCCTKAASNGSDFAIGYYDSRCCSARTRGDAYGGKTIYYYTYSTWKNGCSWDSSDCSSYGYGSWNCSKATCSYGNSSDYNDYCCNKQFTKSKLNNGSNNSAKSGCCGLTSFYDKCFCECGTTNSRVYSNDYCCDCRWSDLSTSEENTCCKRSSFRKDNISRCCSKGVSSDYAPECCHKWSGKSVEDAGLLDSCCGSNSSFYKSNTKRCDCGSSYSSRRSDPSKTCCDYWGKKDGDCKQFYYETVSASASCSESSGSVKCSLSVSPNNSSITFYAKARMKLSCKSGLSDNDKENCETAVSGKTSWYDGSTTLKGNNDWTELDSASSHHVGAEIEVEFTTCELKLDGFMQDEDTGLPSSSCSVSGTYEVEK